MIVLSGRVAEADRVAASLAVPSAEPMIAPGLQTWSSSLIAGVNTPLVARPGYGELANPPQSGALSAAGTA